MVEMLHNDHDAYEKAATMIQSDTQYNLADLSNVKLTDDASVSVMSCGLMIKMEGIATSNHAITDNCDTNDELMIKHIRDARKMISNILSNSHGVSIDAGEAASDIVNDLCLYIRNVLWNEIFSQNTKHDKLESIEIQMTNIWDKCDLSQKNQILSALDHIYTRIQEQISWDLYSSFDRIIDSMITVYSSNMLCEPIESSIDHLYLLDQLSNNYFVM